MATQSAPPNPFNENIPNQGEFLTDEEIAVFENPSKSEDDASPRAYTSNINTDGQGKFPSNVQRQSPTQTLQSVTPGPSGVVSSVGSARGSRFQWTRAVYAVGILAVAGAGSVLINEEPIVPRLKSWIRKIVLEEDDDLVKKIDAKPNMAEETAAAAKAAAAAATAAQAAAAAATDMAKATREMFYSKNEERRKFDELVNLLDAQVREMKVMTRTLQRLEGQNNGQGRTSTGYQEDHRPAVSNSKQQYVNEKTSVRSSSPPVTVKPQSAPPSKSHTEDINNPPPKPNQQPSNPPVAPKTKAGEAGPTRQSSHPFLPSQGSGEGLKLLVQDSWQRNNDRISDPSARRI